MNHFSSILAPQIYKKSHEIASGVSGRSWSSSERLRGRKKPFHKPGLLGNGKRVSFRSLVEFPFSLFIFLDLEPHVTHIARRLNKKLAKKVSQKRPKGCPRESKNSEKATLNISKMRSGGDPRLLGRLDPILARIWHAPWPPFCRPNDPKGRQSDPEWSQMASKGSQNSLKNQCENDNSFHTHFYTKN